MLHSGAVRRGNTLVVVLALTLLLASQIYIVNTLTRGSFRHVGKVNAHVRAIYVGESAFARILARIKGAPWASRWFATSPRAEHSVPLEGGAYSSYVATVPTPEKQADVWIQARYEGAVTVMFWRVRCVDDTLDFYAQVYPVFFTFLPPETPAPTGGPNPTTTLVEDQMEQQRLNAGPATRTLATLSGQLTFTQVARTLGIPLTGQPVDTLTPPGGEPLAQEAYLTNISNGLAALPAMPSPPAPPPAPTPTPLPTPPPLPPAIAAGGRGPDPQTELGRRYPSPVNLTDVLREILARVPSTPRMDADLPTSAYFSDPAHARQEWQAATQEFIVTYESAAFGNMLTHATSFVEEMVRRGSAADGPPECGQAADQLLAYLADVTNVRAQLRGAPPPASADVTPSPRDATGYVRALNVYSQWWLEHH